MKPLFFFLKCHWTCEKASHGMMKHVFGSETGSSFAVQDNVFMIFLFLSPGSGIIGMCHHVSLQ